MTRRRVGQFVAFILAACVVTLIVIGLRGGPSPAPPAGSPPPAPPGLQSVPSDERIAGDPMSDTAIQRIENLALTRVNPETGRLETRLAWATLEPESEGLVTLRKPEAWIYDRTTLMHIRADEGRLVWLSREEEEMPESGDLSGSVRIRVYELNADWSGDPSRDRDENGDVKAPLVAAIDTDSLHFESALGEVTTQDELKVEASGTLFEGRGLVLRISEVALAGGIERRLQYLRIDEGRRLVVAPDVEKPAALTDATPARGAGGGAATAAGVPDSVVLYHMTIDGEVHLLRDGQSIRSERVDAWARLVNRQLPPDAITALPRGIEDSPAPAPKPAPAPDRVADAEPDPEAPVELTWNGPLEIRTLRETPMQLQGDDVAVAFSSPRSSLVAFADEASGFTGRVVGLSYGLTSQRLALLGVGGRGVELSLPEGDLITGRADIDLQRGEGRFTGPGEVRSAELAPVDSQAPFQRARPMQSASWSDGALFHFTFDDAGDIVPDDVTLEGDAQLRDAERLMGGERLLARFTQVQPEDGAEKWLTLSRIEVEGSALVASGETDGVSAQRISADFAAPGAPGEIGDMISVAEGNVRARSQGNEIFAEILELDAAANASGGLTPRRVHARHSVQVTLASVDGADAALLTPDGVDELQVDADQLEAIFAPANGADRGPATVDIQGSPALVTRRSQGQQGVLEADALRLEEAEQRLTVFGAGRANQTLARGEMSYDALGVQWVEGLVYEGEGDRGRVEVLGDVIGRGELDEVQRHLARAERMVLDLQRVTLDGELEPAWRLMGVTVEGDGLAQGDERLARLESRRYFPGPGEQLTELEGLGMLAGATIHARDLGVIEEGEVEVPGAGVLLIEDRRQRDAGEVDAPDVMVQDEGVFGQSFRDLRGTTVFDWLGDFHLDAATGEVRMRRSVRLRHRHPEAAAFMELECEELQAWIERQTDARGRLIEPRLVRVVADHGVFARHGELELLCDHLVYREETGEVVATAAPGNTVTVFDAAKGVHYRSESVTLDVRTGEWRSSGAETVRFPG